MNRAKKWMANKDYAARDWLRDFPGGRSPQPYLVSSGVPVCHMGVKVRFQRLEVRPRPAPEGLAPHMTEGLLGCPVVRAAALARSWHAFSARPMSEFCNESSLPGLTAYLPLTLS